MAVHKTFLLFCYCFFGAGSCDGKSQPYWGQSLQYFDRMLHVKPGGKRIAILVQQDGPRYMHYVLPAYSLMMINDVPFTE